MFELKPINEVVRIAAAGGGFTMNGKLKPTEDLVRIAAAASSNQARIVFVGLQLRPTQDLVRIAAAGKGCVVFEDDGD